MVLLVESIEEGIGKAWNITGLFSQRRQDDRHHVDAVMEISPELPIHDSRFEVLCWSRI